MSVVTSYNLFVDTERNLSTNSTGQDVHLPLGQTPITCGSNEFIRLSLMEFSMYKSWNSVNITNAPFRLRLPGTATQVSQSIVLGNYSNFYDLLNEGLKPKMIIAFNALDVTKTVTGINVDNPPSKSSASTSDNIAVLTVTYSAPHGYTDATAPILQLFVQDGKTYQLLGGKRIRGPVTSDETSKSWNTTVSGANTLKMTAYYPGQIATQTHVYLRHNEQNTNISTSSINQQSNVDTRKTEMTSSNVLGIIPITNSWMRYVAQTENVFFADILSKQVTQLNLRLTDSVGNFFPLTADGQDTDGNRSFTAVIRIDIVSLHSSVPHSLNNPNLDSTTPARFSSAPSSKIGRLESNGLNGANSGALGDGFFGLSGKRLS